MAPGYGTGIQGPSETTDRGVLTIPGLPVIWNAQAPRILQVHVCLQLAHMYL